MIRLSSKTLYALVLLTTMLGACTSSAPKQPQWLNNPAANYPEQRYLTAIGEASSRELAATRARANLSRIFQVAISDSSMDFSTAVVSSSNGQRQVDNEMKVSRFVNADARQVLEGTQIVQYWQDEQGKIYSLAVLEKAPANRRFRDTILRADKKTADLVSYASNQANNPAAALRALEQARRSQNKRDNANRNLTVTSGRGITARYTGEQLGTMIRQSLASLAFAIDSQGSSIDAELENAMATLGIKRNANSVYTLSSRLDAEPVQQIQGWYWLRGSIEMRLDDNGKTIAKKRWPIKVSALQPGLVMQRAKDTLNDKLATYLYQMLTMDNQ